jgi:hypothetical protein
MIALDHNGSQKRMVALRAISALQIELKEMEKMGDGTRYGEQAAEEIVSLDC